MPARRVLIGLALALGMLTLATSAHAQGNGKHKHYAVSHDKALTATKAVLEHQGYDVVKIVRDGDTQVVYYRRGNNGRGKGKGPMERLVIRTVNRRIVFEEVPSAILVDIDIRLKL